MRQSTRRSRRLRSTRNWDLSGRSFQDLFPVFSAIWFDSGYMSVSVYEAGFAGDIAPRAVFLRGFQALMRCIMAGMDQQEQFVAPCR